jgi:hypothetical protein
VKSSGFLISAKRQANSAFADVILHEMSESNSSSDRKKAAENHLKHAYACFLRLHCTKDDLRKSRAWKYGGESIREVEAVCQASLLLGDVKAVSSDFGDWSGGARKSAIFDAALEKCRSLFPSLSGSFFSKKAAVKGKKGKESSEAIPSSGSKRKEPGDAEEMTKVSFEVTVPQDLVAGDTFLTGVKVGDTTRKVKLTVPEGNPASLRFALNVPKDAANAAKSKKAKLNED